MKLLRLIIIVCMILPILFSTTKAWSSSDDLNISLKDPMLAGVFSFVMPGLGQFYSESPLRGILFFAGENICLFGSILSFSDIHIGMVDDFGFKCGIDIKDNLPEWQIGVAIGLGVGFLALHIYNIFDAVNCASEYNANQFRGLEQLGNISYFYSEQRHNVIYSLRF